MNCMILNYKATFSSTITLTFLLKFAKIFNLMYLGHKNVKERCILIFYLNQIKHPFQH